MKLFKLVIYGLIFNACFASANAFAECKSPAFLTFLEKSKRSAPLACFFDKDVSGYYTVFKRTDFDVDFYFFSEVDGVIKEQPVAAREKIGMQLLKIKCPTSSNECFMDLNGNGSPEFIFRVSHEFGAMIFAASYDSKKSDFQFVQFHTSYEDTMEPVEFLSHDDSSEPLLETNKIVLGVKISDMGKITFQQATYKTNQKHRFLLTEMKKK